MDKPTTELKDFIYLNIERLYSLYSQVFEGVVREIVHSYENSLSHTDEQSGRPLSGNKLEAEVAELSRRTENRFLYDDMYNRFEQKVASDIFEAKDITRSNVREKLENVAFVKATGRAEIEDYARMRMFADNFNAIGQAIAHATLKGNEAQEVISNVIQQVGQIRDRNVKAKAKAHVAKQQDVKKLATDMNLQQDEQLLKNIKLFADLFYPDGFDITICPQGETSDVVFKAVIDQQWLRVNANMLRKMYSTYTDSAWTLLGQVTYVPGGTTPASSVPLEEKEHDQDDPSMRDPFRNMFATQRVFERMFLESRNRTEVVVCPLAIYRSAPCPKATGSAA
jgi:hypothetical protein